MTNAVIGGLIFMVGVLMRKKSISDMGNFSLVIRENRLCYRGLYSIVRHPSYVGSILCFLGMLIIDVRLSFLYFVVIFYLSRAVQEEHQFIDNPNYQEYKNKVGMFLPKLKRGNKNDNHS